MSSHSDALLEGCAPTIVRCTKLQEICILGVIYPKIQVLAGRMLFLHSFNSKLFAKREGIEQAAIVKD